MDKKPIRIGKNAMVKKADVIVKSRYKLNSLSLKFITILIAGLNTNDKPNQIYQFRVKDFKELTKLKRKDLHFALKKSIKELLEKPLYIPKPKTNNDKNNFLMFNWLASAEYLEGEGIIEFEISTKLRPYLLQVKEKFLKYKLENILNLKSVYSIRMYEILKDNFEKNIRYGNNTELTISLDKLRELLEIPKSYSYGNSSGIKTRILEKAKAELKEHTDIIFDYEEIKTGRKITHLKFFIRPNPSKLEDNYNKKNEKYFKSRGMFVKLLRDNYSGNKKMFGYKTLDKRNFWLGIDNKGLMYATLGNELRNFNSSESADIYDIWYKIAKNSELYQDLVVNGICLKELYLENKELYLELMQNIILLKKEGVI